MKKALAIGLPLAAIAALAWFLLRPEGPRTVDFERARREDLVSSLVTNGRVEPLEFAVVKSDREGRIARVPVSKGQTVAAGQPIAEFDAADARADLAAAEARIQQIEAELPLYDRGGSPAALAEIDAAKSAARQRREVVRREMETAERLSAKGAATRQEIAEARDRMAAADSDIEALDRKRPALIAPEGRQAVEARLREARAAVDAVKSRIARSVLRSPAAGSLYALPAKPGAFVHAGEVLAEVGRLDRLRAIVYVDEPELGRVAVGMPVQLTWQARPSDSWEGVVDKLPMQVTPLGSRQVGEVTVILDNPGGTVPPGANIDAEIRSSAVKGALTIPRAAVRRSDAGSGVLLLGGDTVQWRAVRLGDSSVTRAVVLEGLADGDAVALPSENPPKPGEKIAPRFP